jgi:hypothetical protein
MAAIEYFVFPFSFKDILTPNDDAYCVRMKMKIPDSSEPRFKATLNNIEKVIFKLKDLYADCNLIKEQEIFDYLFLVIKSFEEKKNLDYLEPITDLLVNTLNDIYK